MLGKEVSEKVILKQRPAGGQGAGGEHTGGGGEGMENSGRISYQCEGPEPADTLQEWRGVPASQAAVKVKQNITFITSARRCLINVGQGY